jgi:peptide deformylase
VAEQGQVRDERLDPEAEARRRLALARIRQFPDPALRMRAQEVDSFDRDLEQLVERMTSLMIDANGIGLAANQVGVLRRIFVFQPTQEEPPRAVVNPQVVECSEELAVDDEGCLSLQGVVVPVERAARITLVGKDVGGGELRLELDDAGARVAQHELDHLDGILVIDRTTAEARKEAMALLRPRVVLNASR